MVLYKNIYLLMVFIDYSKFIRKKIWIFTNKVLMFMKKNYNKRI